MRIIGGDLRRRKLLTPKDDSGPRPLPDRVRESMFNLLRGHFEGAQALDLFAGIGSFGLEAISRGAERVIFFERDRCAAKLLQQNIDSLGVGDRTEVVMTDALGSGPVMRCPQDVNLIMMDPPYAMARDAGEWQRIVQQASRLIVKLHPEGYLLLRTPWPHMIREGEAPAVAPGPKSGRRGPKRGREERPPPPARREVVAIELEEGDEFEGRDLDAIFDKLDRADAERAASRPEPAPAVPADLKIPGAAGPETHPYGTTAVHLYMRAGEQAAEERSKPPASAPE
jgi:16S rRNA (guanine966-N2)-methyltransferase